jgi:hypothetical protein
MLGIQAFSCFTDASLLLYCWIIASLLILSFDHTENVILMMQEFRLREFAAFTPALILLYSSFIPALLLLY